MDLHVSSDLPEPWTGTVRWSLETLAGEAVDSDELAVTAAPHADTRIASLDFAARLTPDTERRPALVGELLRGTERVSLSVHPFVPVKHLDLADPRLEVEVTRRGEELIFRLTSRTLARFVELKLVGAPETVFSDNYFDLPAGRAAVVTCPLPEEWTESKAREALRVRSLFDSYSVQ